MQRWKAVWRHGARMMRHQVGSTCPSVGPQKVPAVPSHVIPRTPGSPANHQENTFHNWFPASRSEERVLIDFYCLIVIFGLLSCSSCCALLCVHGGASLDPTLAAHNSRKAWESRVCLLLENTFGSTSGILLL